MSNKDNVKALITSYSGTYNVIAIPKILINFLGDYNTASLMNQIIFWSDKSKRKDGYFFKSYEEWEEELCLTEYQTRRSINKLKKMGFVDTKLKKANGSPTLHFKYNQDVFSESLVKFVENGNLRNLRNETKETKESLTDDYADDYNIDVESTSDKVEQTDSFNKKNKKENVYKTIITHLNERAGRNFSPTNKATQSQINARMSEGRTVDDFKAVIDLKTEQWKDDSKMSNYLRPSTLFAPTNFENYVNEALAAKPKIQPVKREEEQADFNLNFWEEW